MRHSIATWLCVIWLGACGDDASKKTSDASVDASVASGTPFVYVGGYNGQIRVYRLDLTSGALTQAHNPVDAGSSPSFLAFAPNKAALYALDAVTVGMNQDAGAVQAFRLDKSTGALTFLNRQSSEGDNAAHLSVDGSGAFVFVANYNSGNIAVLPIKNDASVDAAVDKKSTGALAHMIISDATNKHVFVPNKGADTVSQFVFDANSGKLTANSPASVSVASGAGPRHIAFHPTSPFAYLIDELANTMTVFDYNGTSGKLTFKQTISTLPDNFTDTSYAAEVQVSGDGRFVYGSNRVENADGSIVIFAVNPIDGTLSLVGHESTRGKTPRHFQIEESGKLMLVANQDSDTVVTFFVNANTGKLTATNQQVSVKQPTYAGAVYLP